MDWLALMRHHGAPTRLLDFTFSFPVASYFALSKKPCEDADPVVWAVNKTWLTRIMEKWSVKASGRKKRFADLATYRDGKAFRELFLKRDPKLVLSASPFRRNQRLEIQSGIFLCPGNVELPLMALLRNLEGKDKDEKRENYEKNVLKIPIAAGKRNALLRGLDQAGISHASLFPGLDGFAESLRTKVLLFEHLRQMEKNKARGNLSIALLDRW